MSTLAWWSSSVTTISSPGPQPRPRARDRWNVSVVMFWPNAISDAAPFRNSATVPRASAITASVSTERRIAPVRVGVVLEEVVGHRADDVDGDLRAARTVEVRDRKASVPALEGREPASDRGGVGDIPGEPGGTKRGRFHRGGENIRGAARTPFEEGLEEGSPSAVACADRWSRRPPRVEPSVKTRGTSRARSLRPGGLGRLRASERAGPELPPRNAAGRVRAKLAGPTESDGRPGPAEPGARPGWPSGRPSFPCRGWSPRSSRTGARACSRTCRGRSWPRRARARPHCSRVSAGFSGGWTSRSPASGIRPPSSGTFSGIPARAPEIVERPSRGDHRPGPPRARRPLRGGSTSRKSRPSCRASAQRHPQRRQRLQRSRRGRRARAPGPRSRGFWTSATWSRPGRSASSRWRSPTAFSASPMPVAAACELVAGYHSSRPLSEAELAVRLVARPRCVCARASVFPRTGARPSPENPYLLVSEAPAWEALGRMAGVHPRFAHCRLRDACGLPPCPQTPAIEAWLRDAPRRFAPVVAADLGRAVVFDLSVGSPEFRTPAETLDTATMTPRLFSKMREAAAPTSGSAATTRRGSSTAATRSPPLQRRRASRAPHRAHRVDLFMEPGSPVHAPLAGRVHAVHDNAARFDYGPTVILEHAPEGAPRFFTLYGHLGRRLPRESLAPGQEVARGQRIGAIGAPPGNGDWPPHVHFQIVTDMLDGDGEFHGVGSASERAVWLAFSPDPSPLLGVELSRPDFRAATDGSPGPPARRAAHAVSAPVLSLSYRAPLEIRARRRHAPLRPDGPRVPRHGQQRRPRRPRSSAGGRRGSAADGGPEHEHALPAPLDPPLRRAAGRHASRTRCPSASSCAPEAKPTSSPCAWRARTPGSAA